MYFLNKIKREKKIDTEKIIILKNIFSKMESFFHGESSGLDPVNSYLSSPILIKSKNDIETTTIPKQIKNGNQGFFLIDSGESSNTRIFVEKSRLNLSIMNSRICMAEDVTSCPIPSPGSINIFLLI